MYYFVYPLEADKEIKTFFKTWQSYFLKDSNDFSSEEIESWLYFEMYIISEISMYVKKRIKFLPGS